MKIIIKSGSISPNVHSLDLMVRDDITGEVYRPHIVPWIDIRSRKVLSLRMRRSSDSDGQILAFRDAALKYGLPDNVYLDNGREFLVHDFGGRGRRKTDENADYGTAMLERLNIRMVNAKVRNGKAKVIERSFKQVSDEFSRLFITYCGNRPENRPERHNSVIKNIDNIPLASEVLKDLTAYIEGMAILNGLQAVSAARAALAAGATLAEAAATTTATGAQVGFNAALMACPITWIIIGLIAIVAIFYAGIAAVNKFAGTSLSATGIIVGAFAVAGAFIGNLIIGMLNLVLTVFNAIWNIIATFAEFFANVFNDPIASIYRLFLDLFDVVLGIIQGIATAIDTVFGSNLADAVSGFRSDLIASDNAFFGEKKVTIERDIFGSIGERIGYGDAWATGNQFGSSLQDKFMGMFGSDYGDFAGALGDQEYDVNVKDDVNLADESIAYLMDAIQQRYVNNVNVTAPAPNVQVIFAGDIQRDVDLDELAERTKKKIGTEIVEFAMTNPDINRN